MSRPFFVGFCIVFVLLCISCKESSSSVYEGMQAESGMVIIPGGILNMGGDNEQADQNEFPKHKVEISAFMMDETEVTNKQFTKFVDETGYITIAEKELDWEEMEQQLPPNTPKPADSLLAPGSLVFFPTDEQVSLGNPAAWWRWVIGADWRHPSGPDSNIENIMDHPVVHVAYDDAQAYCEWASKRLPTEAEWEWAARGGLKNNCIYPWGNDNPEVGTIKANFYQGLFPYHNSVKDGYERTAPVKSYEPNGYGLYDMAGNVWEWCSDWFDYNFYRSPLATHPNAKGPTKSYNPTMIYQQERVIRGGSFLCNDSYCSGYRNARRMGSTSDSGLNHTGFRCAKSISVQ